MSNKCVLCFVEHDRRWHDQPNMYCEPCTKIRNDARGTVSEIIPNLYLSDMDAASRFDGDRLCVHEHGPTYTGQHHLIAILTRRPNSLLDRSGAVASIEQVDRAADLIQSYVEQNKRLLVHCFGGVERSPLTIAWYFVKTKKFETLDQAYVFLKQKRPVVSDRQFWLP